MEVLAGALFQGVGQNAMTRMFGGRYLLTDLLASSTASDVWQGVDGATSRVVAVKLLRPPFNADPWVAERLTRAQAALGGLWHHGIARLLDVVVVDGDVGLVSDLVPGTDLARHLTATGPLAPAYAAEVAATLADALATAHRLGVVHGDVKPSNVVVPPPEGGTVRLTDFAVASLVRVNSAPSAYRAPEAGEDGTLTGAADVYALGILIHEMITGTPWRADYHGAEPDRRLLDLIDDCVRPDPADRPDAAAVAERLRDLGPEPSRPRRRQAEGRAAARAVARGAGRVGRAAAPRRAAPPRRATPRRRSWSRGRLASVAVLAAAVVIAVFAAAKVLSQPGEAQTGRPGGTSGPGSAASVPALPTTATTATVQGGTDFVRYWFALLDYATATGDTTVLTDATNPDCAECRTAVEGIRSGYANGGSVRGGAYLVRSITNNSFSTLDRSVYDATVDRSPRTTVDGTGAVQASLDGLSFTNCILILEWTAGRWRVLQVATPGCVA